MKKILLIAAAIGASALGGLAVVAQSSGDATIVAAETTESTAQFSVANMTCATCPISVSKAMKRVDGVKSVDIDYETKVATVVYDPAVTTPADIAAASTNVGYPATEFEV
ncbi:MAG: heavy metal-associated domain-containing protein [Pseudomonadota bacterium]|jgi:mercuric ion binding protein